MPPKKIKTKNKQADWKPDSFQSFTSGQTKLIDEE